MSRPRNADGQRTRQAILDAALTLFADKGFFGTSLRDVAAAVGVRESALYNYFPSKDALFDALLVNEQEEKAEHLSALATAPFTDGRLALEQLTTAILERYQQPRQQQLFRVMLSDGIRLARSGRLNLIERMSSGGGGPLADMLRRLIRQGVVRNTDLEMLVVAFISPLIVWRQAHAISADLPMVRNAEEFARRHVEQFLRGAAAPEAATRATPGTRRRGAGKRASRPRGRRLS
jgi:AcrR family transcriptional regulator